jgi:hypothetical protein
VPAAPSGGTTAALIPLLDIERPDALALAALAEPEPWLGGKLATDDHIFIASQRDVHNARELLATLTVSHEHC